MYIDWWTFKLVSIWLQVLGTGHMVNDVKKSGSVSSFVCCMQISNCWLYCTGTTGCPKKNVSLWNSNHPYSIEFIYSSFSDELNRIWLIWNSKTSVFLGHPVEVHVHTGCPKKTQNYWNRLLSPIVFECPIAPSWILECIKDWQTEVNSIHNEAI